MGCNTPCREAHSTADMAPAQTHPPGRLLDTWRCGTNGACNSMAALSWAPHALRATVSSGIISAAASAGLGPESRGGSAGSGALSTGALPASVPEHAAVESAADEARRSWQLLSGHDSGQVLVWNVVRDRLTPVCKLGEPGSAVRAVVSLDAWGLIATAHASGEVALVSRPAQASDWGGGALSTGAGSSSGSIAGPAAPTMSVGIACVRPRRAVLRAHRSSIVAAGGCSGGVVTASGQGTLRLWRSAELAREADRAGLQLHAARRTTTVSTVSSERCAPCAARAALCSPCSPCTALSSSQHRLVTAQAQGGNC